MLVQVYFQQRRRPPLYRVADGQLDPVEVVDDGAGSDGVAELHLGVPAALEGQLHQQIVVDGQVHLSNNNQYR